MWLKGERGTSSMAKSALRILSCLSIAAVTGRFSKVVARGWEGEAGGVFLVSLSTGEGWGCKGFLQQKPPQGSSSAEATAVTLGQVQLLGFQRPRLSNQPRPAWHEGAQGTKANKICIYFSFLKPGSPPAHQTALLLLIPLGLPSDPACVGRMRNPFLVNTNLWCPSVRGGKC